MAELVAVPLEDGGEIVVEMDHSEAGVVKAGRSGRALYHLEGDLAGWPAVPEMRRRGTFPRAA